MREIRSQIQVRSFIVSNVLLCRQPVKLARDAEASPPFGFRLELFKIHVHPKTITFSTKRSFVLLQILLISKRKTKYTHTIN